jgi:large subunit ribosomal protein L19|tara:strand:- start:392 stop:778 length:387 start_codon:yes stop_codon:yes gene_type:complete
MNKALKYIEKNIGKLVEGKELSNFKTGDTVRVHNLIYEGERERVQIFEGVCIAFYNRGIATSFKLKKISKSMVFEKSFPLYSPFVKKIEVIRKGKVRRSKLYYMREFVGKAARIKEDKNFRHVVPSSR